MESSIPNKNVELNSNNKINEQDKPNTDVEEKEKWPGKVAFLFTLVGYSAGLADFWRFPYLAWRNGGGMYANIFIFTQWRYRLVNLSENYLVLEIRKRAKRFCFYTPV